MSTEYETKKSLFDLQNDCIIFRAVWRVPMPIFGIESITQTTKKKNNNGEFSLVNLIEMMFKQIEIIFL